MKKLAWSLLLFLFAPLLIMTPALATFVFQKGELKVDNINTYTSNAKFDSDALNYFDLYFFASPYYATGAEIDGVSIDNPLEIANHTNNPYNSEEPYLINNKYCDYKNANVNYNGTNYYWSTASTEGATTPVTVNSANPMTLYPKRKWSGYIRENGDISETSTYIKISVSNNITNEQLNKIVAQSVFKDRWGFGPEFLGWTFDKSVAKTRAMHSATERYGTADNLVDANGSAITGTAYTIGNFGVQDVTENVMLTSSTSLLYVDKFLSGNDGSAVGDNIIYLYPVFAAKNNLRPALINGASTPFMKLRVNPGTDYVDKQSGEVNYSINRYTYPMRQTNKRSDTDFGVINYFTENVYLSCSATDTVQLDVNPLSGSVWSGSWGTMVDNANLISGLSEGYYSFDITFRWSYSPTSVSSVKSAFEATNKYIKVITSNNGDGAQYVAGSQTWFVIGIKKDYQYRATGTFLSGASIGNYDAFSKYSIYSLNATTSEGGTNSSFYFSKNISFLRNNEFTLLHQNETNDLNDLTYTFSKMSSANIDIINDFIDNGVELNGNNTHYKELVDSDFLLTGTGAKSILARVSGTFDFLFIITTTNGIPTSVHVAYREAANKRSIVILNSKPAEEYFFDIEALRNDTSFVAYISLPLSSLVTNISEFTIIDGTKKALEDILALYPNKVLVDTASNFKIPLSVFANNEFVLNQDYVLYLSS